VVSRIVQIIVHGGFDYIQHLIDQRMVSVFALLYVFLFNIRFGQRLGFVGLKY
jgi:hypothetical protein